MDAKLFYHDQYFDLGLENNDIALDDGLQTAVIISLFSDQRIEAAELPTGETDQRGWWGDVYPDIEGDQTGSRLWILQREKQTEETRRRAAEYAKESLQWLIDDKVAESIETEAEWLGPGFLGLAVTIQRPKGSLTFSFKLNWNAEIARENGL